MTTASDSLDHSTRYGILIVRGMQLALLGLSVYGLATLRVGMAANGALALGVTVLPALIRREYTYSMDARLVLWITVSVFLHSFGALGPYRRFPWYDAVTHTVSAVLIAGLGYATLRALERHSEDLEFPPVFRGVFIVVFVLAAGVLWEILEFASGGIADITGAKAPLVVMGIDDIVSDLLFNTVGALLVAVWGTGYFDGLARFFRRRLRSGE